MRIDRCQTPNLRCQAVMRRERMRFPTESHSNRVADRHVPTCTNERVLCSIDFPVAGLYMLAVKDAWHVFWQDLKRSGMLHTRGSDWCKALQAASRRGQTSFWQGTKSTVRLFDVCQRPSCIGQACSGKLSFTTYFRSSAAGQRDPIWSSPAMATILLKVTGSSSFFTLSCTLGDVVYWTLMLSEIPLSLSHLLQLHEASQMSCRQFSESRSQPRAPGK